MRTVIEKFRAVVHGTDGKRKSDWRDDYVTAQRTGDVMAATGESYSVEKRYFVEDK